jgi:glycosyltransferase involved in cell wall biosynthesis
LEKVLLSVVIPVFQGAPFLEELARRLAEVRRELEAADAPVVLTEAIFVDDGSVDGSGAVLQELRSDYDWVQIVSLSRNFGQHPATIAGVLHTSGDWIATLDEDLQHRPEDLVPILKHAIRNGLDVVYASPKGSVHESWIRDRGSRAFKRIAGLFTGNPFVPLFNSFRMMRGSVARAAAAVCANDPYYDIAICWFTDRIGSLELKMTDRRFAETRASGYSLRTLIRHAGRMLSSSEMRFLRIFAVLGALALAGSVLLSLVVVGMKVLRPAEIKARGWASLVVVISFFGGLASFLAGVLVELVSNLVVRAKGKPTFFVVDRSGDHALMDWANNPVP